MNVFTGIDYTLSFLYPSTKLVSYPFETCCKVAKESATPKGNSVDLISQKVEFA